MKETIEMYKCFIQGEDRWMPKEEYETLEKEMKKRAYIIVPLTEEEKKKYGFV